MIIKGNIRAGGQNLANHLMNTRDNDSVELAEARGFVSDELSGAFAEIEAIASATKGEKPIYSLSLNPSEPMTRDQYAHAIETIENKLGFTDQPRAVVFHVKDGREHAHVAWSRVDTEQMKIIHMEFDRQKLRECAITLAREFGHDLPDGLAKDRGADRYKDRFNDTSFAEKAQEQRTGMTKAERIEVVTTAYRQSDNAQSFNHALEEKGFILAKGDKRGCVVVDIVGDVHSLSRCIQGETTKSIQDTLKLDDLDSLPSVQRAKELHAERLRDRAAQKPRDTFDAQERVSMAEKHIDAIREAHRAELKAVKGAYADQLEAINRREREAIDNARDAVKDAYKPEWAQLFKAQRAEMKEIKDHLKNPVTRLKWMMNNPDYDLLDTVNRGHLSKAFNFIVTGKADLSKIEKQHQTARMELSRAQKIATQSEIREIKSETKIKRTEAHRDHKEEKADLTKDHGRTVTEAERNLKRANEVAEKAGITSRQQGASHKADGLETGFGNIGFGKQGFEKERDEKDDERERFIKPPGQSFDPF